MIELLQVWKSYGNLDWATGTAHKQEYRVPSLSSTFHLLCTHVTRDPNVSI